MNITKENIDDNGIVRFTDSDDPKWSGSFHINNPDILVYLSQQEVDAILAEQGEATRSQWLYNWQKDSGQLPVE